MMNGMGVAGEPSMEEILASIRRIIAEDADGSRDARDQGPAEPPPPHVIDNFARHGTNTLSEPDFDLPSILRPGSSAPERPAGVLNRLADALLGGNGAAAPAGRPAEPARTFEDDLADLLDGPPTRSQAQNPPSALAVPVSPRFQETPPPSIPTVAMPQEAQRLLASLDESLAMLSDSNQSRDRLRDLATRVPLVSVGDGGAPLTAPPVPSGGFAEAAPKRPVVPEPSAIPDVSPGESPSSPDMGTIAAPPPAVIAAMAAPANSPARNMTPPALPTVAEPEKPASPAAKAKAANGAAASEKKLAADAKPVRSAEGSTRKKKESHLPETPSIAGSPPVIASPSPTSPTEAPTPSLSSEAMDKARGSVISAAEFFINGVAGKANAAAPSGANETATALGATLDAAAAELLRPMLRQWLAENMPRIMEAALRAEITKSAVPPEKPKT